MARVIGLNLDFLEESDAQVEESKEYKEEHSVSLPEKQEGRRTAALAKRMRQHGRKKTLEAPINDEEVKSSPNLFVQTHPENTPSEEEAL